MKVHTNTIFKNEAVLLKEVLPIWEKYPVDKFVFYDDNSTDESVDIIKEILEDRCVILNNNLKDFHESHHRSTILEYSRENNATHVVSIDCDELLSTNLLQNFNEIVSTCDKYNLHLYQYNVVNGLDFYRQDPAYENNYRNFIISLKKTHKFDTSQSKFHTPRIPKVNLVPVMLKDAGFIHLQAINRKFYALKQLWYKHYEYRNYDHTIGQINQRYDPVVNGLNFKPVTTPKNIIDGIKFDISIYDSLEEMKGYKKYILEKPVDELITFGKAYLEL